MNAIISRVREYRGLSEQALCTLIVVQCVLLVVDKTVNNALAVESIQVVIDLLFLIDLGVKINKYGVEYFKKPMNVADLFIVLLSVAGHFFVADAQALTALRIIRLLRMLRILSLIPHVESVVSGVGRSIKASRGVFLMLLVLLTFFSVCGYLLFHNVLPSHFSDPFVASYTVFSLFTVEGWNEVPALVQQGSLDYYLIRAYVIAVIVFGSFFALSLANAIFIDEMVLDNNHELEVRIEGLTHTIEKQNQQIQQLTEIINKMK
ncbi:ion transporter [Ferrimonas aestuarii]|uniref:Ion transporter n=1 Tax=Ferrimonas aestuarii TaxID=2569539 RepID=A0A4U1BLC3_9GAMM|nr:ion transporter [Ferrimonas aestuarii]TKB52752.1 ion transporter [Ferrimonas aestuarii]